MAAFSPLLGLFVSSSLSFLAVSMKLRHADRHTCPCVRRSTNTSKKETSPLKLVGTTTRPERFEEFAVFTAHAPLEKHREMSSVSLLSLHVLDRALWKGHAYHEVGGQFSVFVSLTSSVRTSKHMCVHWNLAETSILQETPLTRSYQ